MSNEQVFQKPLLYIQEHGNKKCPKASMQTYFRTIRGNISHVDKQKLGDESDYNQYYAQLVDLESQKEK